MDRPLSIATNVGTESFTYNDWTSAATDRNGNTSTTTVDARGNLTSVVDALGNTTSYQYDENNRQHAPSTVTVF